MGRKSKSKTNKIEGTLPPGPNLSGNTPNENLVDSSLKEETENLQVNKLLSQEVGELREKNKLLEEEIKKLQDHKEDTKLLSQEVGELREKNKLLEEEILKLQDYTKKGPNVMGKTSENVMDFERDISFRGDNYKTSNDTYPATQWANADSSGSKCAMQVDDPKDSKSWYEEGASGFEANASSAYKQTYKKESSDGEKTYQEQKTEQHGLYTGRKDHDRKVASGVWIRKGACGTNRRLQKDTYDNNRDYSKDRRDNFSQKHSKRDQDSLKVKLLEIDGDLFSAPENSSLAHCVAADLRMGSGIAVKFRQDFKRVEELLNQGKKVGDVAILEDKDRYIYYLISKKFSNGKPTHSDLYNCLMKMKDHMGKNSVTNLAIPRIGCGLDRLHWKDVRKMLLDVFADVNVTITVYNFTENPDAVETSHKRSCLRITDKIMKLVHIEKNTLLLLFGSECGYVDSAMKELNEKYPLINEYKRYSRKLGDIVEIRTRNEIICVLIVKTHHTNSISYPDLSECLLKVRKLFKEEKYFYLGISAFVDDDDDDLTVAKIVTMFKSIFNHVESNLWICWPSELVKVYNEYFPRAF